jgi:hypothetical protein
VAYSAQPGLLGNRPHREPGAGQDEQRYEEPRRELLEGVAVGEHEPPHSVGIATQRELA